jgi:monoamine oxidase
LTRNSNERTLRSNPMQDVLVSRFSKVVPYAELNTQIKNINYSSGKIQLSGFRNGTEQFSAEVDKVIVTVPVSVLRSNDLTFSPSLPQTMTTALSKVAMDASIRVALDFKQNFWGNDVAFIYGGSIAPEYFAGGLGRSQFNKTLSITINGSRAEALSAKSEDQIINELLSELDKAFEGKATLNVRRDDTDKPIYIIRDWSKQPFIKGGISYLRPGASIEDRSAFAEPVQNVLFFAGEATHPTEAGTINGALLSAERAAQQLVSSIVGA